jgi:NitT/TauT family transport system substrate-binding protein
VSQVIVRMSPVSLLVAIAFVGCSGETATKSTELSPTGSALQSVKLALNWHPEAEHGGFYAALVHGYFEEEGLQVEIIPGGPNVPVIQQVATKQIGFGIANADQILLGRAAEAPAVAVMAPLQDSPRCIMVHRKSGIKDFAGLKNVTLGITSTNTFALFLQKQGLLKDVQIVPYPGNVSQFLVNENFAQQAYIFSEPFVVEQAGGDPQCLMVSDLGFNPYTSVLFTHPDLIRQQPDLVQKMVRASVRGWRKYLEDPQETNRHIHRQNPQMGQDILEYGVEALKPLCLNDSTSAEQIGRMTPDRWTSLAEQLVEAGAIKAGAVKPEEAFTTRFLDELIGNES